VSTLSPARPLDRPAEPPRPAGRLGELARRWRRAAPPGGAVPALARSRRLRQSGRAVVLWALAFYALAQPALLAFLDWWHPSLYENSVREKWGQLRELTAAAPDRPLLVMVGSSRTEAALQAGRLDGLPGPGGRPWRAYNFGVPTVGPMREALYLREMLDAGTRPRLLLLEFLPPLFGRPHPDITCEENWTHAEWLSLTQLRRLRPYFAAPDRKRDEWLLGRLAPAHAFRVELQSWLNNGNEDIWPVCHPHDRWGWRLPEERPPKLLATMRQTAWNMYFATLCRFRMGKGGSRAMRDVLALCRREQIPVVLVLTPEGSLFRGWYSPAAREGPRRLLEELREAYRVPVIDATEWLPDSAFTDGHHVTAEGATAFTDRLLEELQRLPEWTGVEGPQVAAR
jgi:hypothetical protein